jgi:ParB-like chromosome segregation protein Spo0J
MRLREHPAIGEGRTDILPADPRLLKVMDGYNVRDLTTPEARAELDDLKALIKEHGVKTALVVKFDGQDIWIVEGHRRHKAAMELIAEFDASGGAQGRNIDTVPVKAEPLGTNDVDRDFGLETSNSGARLKPLELANLIYRLKEQRGLSLDAIARGLGKSDAVIKNHLEMRAVIPEGVKEQVREGVVSATEAVKIVKNLPKGMDPDEAAKIIQANKEENEKFGIGKRNKVTTRTIRQQTERKAPPKAEPEAKTETAPVTASVTAPAPEPQAEPLSPDEAAQAAADATQAVDSFKPTFVPLSDLTPPRPANKIEALLLGFVAATAPELATQTAKLRSEQETIACEGGDDSSHALLWEVADMIGHLRFPDEWDQAKANTELQAVA